MMIVSIVYDGINENKIKKKKGINWRREKKERKEKKEKKEKIR